MSSAKLKANNDWLVWARETAYYDIDKIAEKMKVDSNQIEEWESTGKIEYTNLVKLAKHYKRPPMIFFNLNKPKNIKQINDFRSMGSKKVEITPEISFELRNAEVRRKRLLNFEEESKDYSIPEFELSNLDNNSSSELAYDIRDRIGMKSANMKRRDLDYWIKQIESLGILIFQFYGFEPKEIRGYAIYHDKLPIIGINSREYENGKKFTLFHELAHIIQKNEGLSNFNEYFLKNKEEIYCNNLAAEILVPSNILTNLIVSRENQNTDQRNIEFFSKHFRVSKEVIIRRLLTLKFISKSEYKNNQNTWDSYIGKKDKTNKKTSTKTEKKPKDNELPIDHSVSYKRKATNILNRNGIFYTESMIRAYDDNLISIDDLVENLGVPIEVIDQIRNRLNEEES
jgi:Zn-dependent peptidase ImmA (M78 family)